MRALVALALSAVGLQAAEAPGLATVYRTSSPDLVAGSVITYVLQAKRGGSDLIDVAITAQDPNGGLVQFRSNGTVPAVSSALGLKAPLGRYTVTQIALTDGAPGSTVYYRDGRIVPSPTESGFKTHSIQFSDLDFTVVVPAGATTVTDAVTADTTWTAAGSPYLLANDISVASGATLTIAPGATVVGGAHSITVFGRLAVAGTAESPVAINNVLLAPGPTTPDQPSAMDITHAVIKGGAIWPHTRLAVYGTVNVRDSYLAELIADDIYLWYPVGNCTFERNVFVDCFGFSIGVGHGYSPQVSIRTNVFYTPRISDLGYSLDGGAIVAVWANTGGTIDVTGNSFLALPAGWVLKLPSDQPTAALSAPNNYWGALSATDVSAHILDATKGSSYASTITYLPILSAPDPATPAVPTPPSITSPPMSRIVNQGNAVSLAVEGATDPATIYEWKTNGTTVAGATNATLTMPQFSAADAGDYTVTVTNVLGTVTSRPASLSLLTSWLANLSVRSSLQPGQAPLIVGMATNSTKPILLRAGGPVLANFHVANVLANPALAFYPGGATVPSATNDDWASSVSATAAALGAFPFPAGSKDSALVTPVSGGSTVVQTGAGSGVVLIEAYDTAPDSPASRLVNLSARNFVGTGENVLIAGFTVRGAGTKKLLIRGVGPALTGYGVTQPLSNPRLDVFVFGGPKIAENDDWDASLASTFEAANAFPLDVGSKDAALVLSVPPGIYTAQLSGVGNETGIALVEIYEAP